jgi:hypothetical protein
VPSTPSTAATLAPKAAPAGALPTATPATPAAVHPAETIPAPPSAAAEPPSTSGVGSTSDGITPAGQLPGEDQPMACAPFHSLVYVDGEIAPAWRCCSHRLPCGHIISVVRGPVSAAIDAWGGLRRSFQREGMPTGELRARLASAPRPFRRLGVRDLVPPEQRETYDEIVRAQAANKPLAEVPAGRPLYHPMPPPPPPKGQACASTGALVGLAAGMGSTTSSSSPPSWFNHANASGSRPQILDPFGVALWGGAGGGGGPPFRTDASGGAEDDCIVS